MLRNLLARTNSQPRRLNGKGIIATIGWIALTFLISQAVYFVVAFIYIRTTGDTTTLTTPYGLMVASALMYVCMLAILLGAGIKSPLLRTNRSELAFRGLPTWVDVSLPFVAFVVYMGLTWLFATAIQAVVPGFDVQQPQDLGFSQLSTLNEYVIAFVALVVVAPLVEELIFRGYLYGRLKRFGVPVWGAILVTSLLFGLVHIQPNVIVDTFALSIVLCLLREMTGSIWAGVVLHSLKNFVAFYLLFINTGLFTTIGS